MCAILPGCCLNACKMPSSFLSRSFFVFLFLARISFFSKNHLSLARPRFLLSVLLIVRNTPLSLNQRALRNPASPGLLHALHRQRAARLLTGSSDDGGTTINCIKRPSAADRQPIQRIVCRESGRTLQNARPRASRPAPPDPASARRGRMRCTRCVCTSPPPAASRHPAPTVEGPRALSQSPPYLPLV